MVLFRLRSPAVSVLSAASGTGHARNQGAHPRTAGGQRPGGHADLGAPTPIDERDILRHHTPEYLAKVRAISEHGGGDVGEGAWVGPHCYDIVRLSAGACAAVFDSVLDGKVDNIYVLCRPAGHHATRDAGRGFCVLSNIPIAILRARASSRVQRAAVLDWDVHHGNGTQDAFYQDPDVLTISHPPGRQLSAGVRFDGGRTAKVPARATTSIFRCRLAADTAPIWKR